MPEGIGPRPAIARPGDAGGGPDLGFPPRTGWSSGLTAWTPDGGHQTSSVGEVYLLEDRRREYLKQITERTAEHRRAVTEKGTTAQSVPRLEPVPAAVHGTRRGRH